MTVSRRGLCRTIGVASLGVIGGCVERTSKGTITDTYTPSGSYPSSPKTRIAGQLNIPGEAAPGRPTHCLLHEETLNSFGLRVGDQVRLDHRDQTGVQGNFTVSGTHAGNQQSVRVSPLGAARLAADADAPVAIDRRAVRSDLSPSEARAQAEITERSSSPTDPTVLVSAPHGGSIEEFTGKQVGRIRTQLADRSATPATHQVFGFGDRNMGAFARWHITSTNISLNSYRKLGSITSHSFRTGVALHRWRREEVLIGGRAPDWVRRTIADRVQADMDVPIVARDNPEVKRWSGKSPRNYINRVSKNGGIQIEQPGLLSKQWYLEFADSLAQALGQIERQYDS
jgi:phage replication-related protein YjqB (UPF0714/DUF867 family)